MVVVMSEVQIPILIDTRRDGKKPVIAWARSEDATLACHHLDGDEAREWSITHRKTGLRINPSMTHSKSSALALIDLYAPLADWNAVADDPDAMHKLRETIEAVYEQFEQPALTKGQ